MLVVGIRDISRLHLWSDYDGKNVASATLRVGSFSFVKNNDQDSVRLESRAGQKRSYILLQEGIGLTERAIVGIVVDIGNYERELGKLIVGQVGRELRKRHKIGGFAAAVHNVAEIGERVVAFHVRAGVATGVAGIGQALCVGLPGLSSRDEVAHDVVIRICAAIAVIVSEDLPGRKHEVVAD